MGNRGSVAIVGLGLVGTSVGLALQRDKGNYVVVGHDVDGEAMARAKKLGAVDKTGWDLVRVCKDADLIMLAIPFKEIKFVLEAIAPDLKPGSLVVDFSTVKKPVREWAEELLLPKGIGYIGVDTIRPVSAKPAPSAAAFEKGTMTICALPDTPDSHLTILSDLAGRMGMKVLFMNEEEHDSLRAVTTHLPMLLGASFLNATAGHEAWREIRRLAGDEFGSITGLVGDPEETLALILANKHHIRKWLEIYLAVLGKWNEAIEGGDTESLSATLKELASARDEWMGASISGRWEERQIPEIRREGIISRLFGIHPRRGE